MDSSENNFSSISSPLNNIDKAAHDLKNLLNNVINGIDILKENLNGNNDLIKIVNHIEKNSALASEIVMQLASNNNISDYLTKINISKTVTDVVNLFKDSSNNSVTFHIGENSKQLFICGNYIELKRVFLNLFTNAKESSDKSLIINIDIEQFDEEFVKILVSDNGPGIPNNNLAKLFDEGFSTKDKKENKGLGLSIVKNIIDKHRGKIKVKSKVNYGTEFEIFLPIYSENFDSSKIENRKVIIAEDDEFQREVLRDLLTSMKLNVFTASNGVEALEIYISQKPDIMFLDNSMPGMNGIECSEKIKEIDKDSKIVLLTGSNFKDSSLENKITKVLTKPYDFDSIRFTLNELL
ncbi:MAG: hybrid sensor histidine kinase/response regulator [Ignavibacteriae bacterium]|nr:hybrid sensor histidine kinase/response regulator [Ignavibacteriota bacterium]MCB9207729.1 hybrid sensor histidine kinase/response regulator [Ignavibacteriales bacterium]MCB9258499.1 hybrid sensor histidine kinase/response regulator [Ignavibacteriales bacterium]